MIAMALRALVASTLRVHCQLVGPSTLVIPLSRIAGQRWGGEHGETLRRYSPRTARQSYCPIAQVSLRHQTTQPSNVVGEGGTRPDEQREERGEPPSTSTGKNEDAIPASGMTAEPPLKATSATPATTPIATRPSPPPKGKFRRLIREFGVPLALWYTFVDTAVWLAIVCCLEWKLLGPYADARALLKRCGVDEATLDQSGWHIFGFYVTPGLAANMTAGWAVTTAATPGILGFSVASFALTRRWLFRR